LARPRDLPCPIIARVLDGPAASYPRMVHTAAGLDMASRVHPQRSSSIKPAHRQHPALFGKIDPHVARLIPGVRLW
jgi:hypothetical protein